jgi:hypothetical protein
MPATYTLDTIRGVIKKFIALMDAMFPGSGAKVIVKEGGWTNSEPWYVIVAPDHSESMRFVDGFKAVEFRIDPQTMLDYISGGGGFSENDYVSGLFSKVVSYFTDNARNPEAFMKLVNDRMYGAMQQLGITPNDRRH